VPHYSIGYGVSGEEVYIFVDRSPWSVIAAEKIIEIICNLTRNYACQYLCDPFGHWAEKRRSTFREPCTPEYAKAMAEWLGLRTSFWEDDE
jgi:hypothetical protein